MLEQFREYLIKTPHGTAICLICPIGTDKLPMSGQGQVGGPGIFGVSLTNFYHLTL